jgi:hypothetical protein
MTKSFLIRQQKLGLMMLEMNEDLQVMLSKIKLEYNRR